LLEEKEKEKQQQQEQRFGPGIRKTTPTVYRVTTGSLSEYTKATYQYDINDFLAFYKITDIKGYRTTEGIQS
jgi:hypothetical protein